MVLGRVIVLINIGMHSSLHDVIQRNDNAGIWLNHGLNRERFSAVSVRYYSIKY
jgi:hypothetical protein